MKLILKASALSRHGRTPPVRVLRPTVGSTGVPRARTSFLSSKSKNGYWVQGLGTVLTLGIIQRNRGSKAPTHPASHIRLTPTRFKSQHKNTQHNRSQYNNSPPRLPRIRQCTIAPKAIPRACFCTRAPGVIENGGWGPDDSLRRKGPSRRVRNDRGDRGSTGNRGEGRGGYRTSRASDYRRRHTGLR